MSLTSPVTILLAAALASPELYRALLGEAQATDAALRFLICVPVAALMLAVLRGLTRNYGAAPRRRAADQPAADGSADGDSPAAART